MAIPLSKRGRFKDNQCDPIYYPNQYSGRKVPKPIHIVIETLLKISQKNVINSADQKSLKVIAKYLEELQTEINNQFINPERNQYHESKRNINRSAKSH